MKPTITFLVWLHASRNFDLFEELEQHRQILELTRDLSVGTYP